MRAAITTCAQTFQVVDLPDPAPASDELVLQVAACGICGSDLKARPFMPAGTVMGHELGGEVVAAGADARNAGWREGAFAAALPVISCGLCAWCAAGEVAHCPSVRFIGMGSDRGGFAEFAVVPARHAFAVPRELPSPYTALVEPFAVGFHAVNAAEIGPSDEVLVIGAGGVGLTTVAWARASGAGRVTAIDPDPGRREAAGVIGAHDALASITDADLEGYDVVIECVGNPALVAAAPTALRARGRLIVAGACDQPIPIEPVSALLKELTLRFSVCYRPSEFRTVIDSFASGKIDPSKFVGPVVGLGRLGEAFDLVQTARSEGRVLVAPSARD